MQSLTVGVSGALLPVGVRLGEDVRYPQAKIADNGGRVCV